MTRDCADPTVLLTGFGPFPGMPVNISVQFVEKLAKIGQQNFAKTRFVTAALPTVWRQAPDQLQALYITHQPTFAVHFGVSHTACSLTVEAIAKNRAECKDAHGKEPDCDILCLRGPTQRMTTLPTARIVTTLQRQSIPAVLSQDAGSYLCNAVLYHGLGLMSTLNPQGCCGFIHLPFSLSDHDTDLRHHHKRAIAEPEMSIETALAGGLELLAILLNHRRQL